MHYTGGSSGVIGVMNLEETQFKDQGFWKLISVFEFKNTRIEFYNLSVLEDQTE